MNLKNERMKNNRYFSEAHIEYIKTRFKQTISSTTISAQKRYKIHGIYGVKRIGDGVLRYQKTFKQYLNTEHGVLSFLNEQSPFKEVHIEDLVEKKDKTDYFMKLLNGEENV